MTNHAANLDALIAREDFEILSADSVATANLGEKLKISEFEEGSITYASMKKPDFQRETANWEPEKVAELVRCFVDGELIPSLILWRSPKTGSIFVIDGAHRLSALIAWVHNDYGDGTLSRKFFQNLIPKEQQDAADKVRKLISKTVGHYADLKKAAQYPENSPALTVKRARNLGSFAVQLQWVNGDTASAEDAFFRINQKATEIEKTELKMIEGRKKANAIAARAIIRSGVGHKYWSVFSKENQEQIEKLAKDIYQNIFLPPLDNPIKTLDLPIAGRGYSADGMKMVFNLVNLANKLSLDVKPTSLSDDENGITTIEYLKNVRKLVWQICSDHNSSLGLHPAIYFYSSTGRFSPTAFLAIGGLVKKLDETNRFFEFTKHRHDFEEFVYKHKYFINQITIKYGSASKGYARLLSLYELILKGFKEGKNESKILSDIQIGEFKFLKILEEEDISGRKFNSEIKSKLFLTEAVPNTITCKICLGRMHKNSITTDHIVRQQDGGRGTVDNGQLTHPYCNTGYKEKLESTG